MTAWPLHFVFALILVGSLAAKARTTDVLDESTSIETATIRVARSQGLVFRGYTSISDADIRALVFDPPGCPRPILVVWLLVTFDQRSLLLSAREPGYAERYVYIDHSWDKPHRVAVFVERMKYAALAALNLTQYVPSWHLLLVESAPECKAADNIDWRMVWNREYLFAASIDGEAVKK
jgi:hypothetical protein